MNDKDTGHLLRDVLVRFPDAGPRIQQLFRQNEQFRELCADYSECMLVLEQLRNWGSRSGDLIEQYAELRVSLEQELSERIGATAES